jgi:hypothetical protein
MIYLHPILEAMLSCLHNKRQLQLHGGHITSIRNINKFQCSESGMKYNSDLLAGQELNNQNLLKKNSGKLFNSFSFNSFVEWLQKTNVNRNIIELNDFQAFLKCANFLIDMGQVDGDDYDNFYI